MASGGLGPQRRSDSDLAGRCGGANIEFEKGNFRRHISL
jgi:hypothetical protein